MRIELAIKGREYALKNNDIKIVAKQILNKLNSSDYDYYPQK